MLTDNKALFKLFVKYCLIKMQKKICNVLRNNIMHKSLKQSGNNTVYCFLVLYCAIVFSFPTLRIYKYFQFGYC